MKTNLKFTVALTMMLAMSMNAWAQIDGDMMWKHHFGGSSTDYYYSTTAVSDGIVAVGNSVSGSFNTGDWAGVTGKGSSDAIVVKYDMSGTVLWKKYFGGSNDDYFQSVTAVSDGIVAVGYSSNSSFNTGDWAGVTGKGNRDAIVVKYDNSGTVLWKRNFGGSNDDYYYSVTAVSDGIVAVGYSNSGSFNTGDWAGVTGKGDVDAIMVKYFSPIPITTYSDTLCFGKSYDFGGETYTVAGTYYDTLESINGYDSIIELVLDFYLPIPLTTYSDTLCFGKSYDFGGETYTVAGTYYDTLKNINGCDSIIELVLDFYPSIPVFNYLKSIVEGETYNDANFTNLTQAGMYCDTLENVNGCDSVVCLTLTVNANGIVGARHALPLQVYPNPAGNQLTISLPNSEGGAYEAGNVAIYDVVGQMVYQINKPTNNQQITKSTNNQINNTTIDISHLANGMYFLKVDNKVVKFVKE